MAVAQSIGNEHQLFSRGKKSQEVTNQESCFISKMMQNYLGTVEFCLFFLYLTLWTGLIRNGSMLQTFIINGSG